MGENDQESVRKVLNMSMKRLVDSAKKNIAKKVIDASPTQRTKSKKLEKLDTILDIFNFKKKSTRGSEAAYGSISPAENSRGNSPKHFRKFKRLKTKKFGSLRGVSEELTKNTPKSTERSIRNLSLENLKDRALPSNDESLKGRRSPMISGHL